MNLKMEVVCGGTTGDAHGGNILSSGDGLPLIDRGGGAVGIKGGNTVAVVDFNIFSPARVIADLGDRSGLAGIY